MIEIWRECAKFQITSQRLADQVRTIIKKGWFSDLEILEIHQKTLKQNYDTVPDTSSGVKQKQYNRQLWKIKTPHSQTIHYQATRKKHYHNNKR